MKNMTLRNNSNYVAQFVVTKDQLVVARIPGIEPNATMLVPTDNTYQVIATAVIDGNTYISAPLDVSGPTGFLAQVLQVRSQGTYEFNVREIASRNPNQLQFQKTCLSPVTFTITKNGRALQSVVVTDSFEVQPLNIGDTFSIYAVVNGVTTDTVVTSNPTATVTAVTDTSDLESGYATLDLS
ncbi:hypothetical protein [Xanthomonas sp. D-109]|uniref:hypothetical protein n=1 Tax=Xanthomonas sp. D-109 TaxID=2821274 RepID=UPI001ADC57FE|nr:hypothetical protein [Xanthomonas sp. D-109]MBO9880838.1 hypothetical protein [Xanthomonas sp. D-109]